PRVKLKGGEKFRKEFVSQIASKSLEVRGQKLTGLELGCTSSLQKTWRRRKASPRNVRAMALGRRRVANRCAPPLCRRSYPGHLSGTDSATSQYSSAPPCPDPPCPPFPARHSRCNSPRPESSRFSCSPDRACTIRRRRNRFWPGQKWFWARSASISRK